MNKDLFNSGVGLTFDDVLIVPGYSEMLPHEVDVSTKLTQQLSIKIPLMSAAMDTVTEDRLAITLAMVGGVGMIHRNQTAEDQAEDVRNVKAVVLDDAQKEMAAMDASGRLLVGAAVGVSAETELRIEKMLAEGLDVAEIDTAHGHTKGVIEAIKRIKKIAPNLPVIAGNVVTAEGTKALIDAGADGVKVGVGAGSICTTRIVSGCGMPQVSAVHACAEAAKGTGVPVIADGGIKYSGEIAKAIAAGADSVMLGSLFAGLDESPGELIEVNGRLYKAYRGMGSVGAMQGYGKDRYGTGQTESKKMVPEGIEGSIGYRGSLADFVYQMVGGLRSAMGYAGATTIEELKIKTRLVRITNAGLIESHPHDVAMVKDAPNYTKK